MMGAARCECGAQRPRSRKACESCAWLDGTTSGDVRLIWALREMGGRGTTREILITGWGGAEPGMWSSCVRPLRRLLSLGRIEEAGEDDAGSVIYRLTRG